MTPLTAANRTVKIIGLGGVGGMLVRPLCLFMASLSGTARIVLIDGDQFDPAQNAARMLFDGSGNKAALVREDLLRYFATSRLTMVAIEEYVTPENVGRLIHDGDIVVLCVDNHRTRQLVNAHCCRLGDVCLLSGGNDGVGVDSTGILRRGTFGNVQAYVRRDGRDLTPSLAEFHPEIANPGDKHPAEASCMELIASTPQILPTNMQTASSLLTTLYLYLCSTLHFGELVFDIGEATMNPLPLPCGLGQLSRTGG
jgi:molybdopterin/thiamine biosynthesis adenylyltransferase